MEGFFSHWKKFWEDEKFVMRFESEYICTIKCTSGRGFLPLTLRTQEVQCFCKNGHSLIRFAASSYVEPQWVQHSFLFF